MRGIVLSAGDGERSRSPLGGDVTFLTRGEQSGGALAVIEVVNPAGGGPPLHRHNDADEVVFVLDGEVRWKLDGELATTGPGGYVFIPRGVAHTWHAMTDARMLIAFTPAGMEGFFDALASMTSFDLGAFTRAANDHQMDVLGPPLQESS